MAQGPYINRAPDYTDLDLDFFANPATGDVSKKVGAEAIKRAVRNLVFTSFYDRPFQSWIGSNVRKMLFEPNTPLTANMLKTAITDVINNFEPRVKLIEVAVKDDSDNNGYSVTLQYVILNRQLPVVTSLFLERIR